MSRRELIRRLIEEEAVQLFLDPSAWLGELTVSTRNTVYKFANGICTGVHRAGQPNARSDFLGMRLAGWLIDEDSAPHVSPTWRPGASAVLLRPGPIRDAVALTSATTQIRRSKPAVAPKPRDSMKSSGIVRRTPPPVRLAVADSMTRIGVPAARRRR
jgi:hypothetical protein